MTLKNEEIGGGYLSQCKIIVTSRLTPGTVFSMRPRSRWSSRHLVSSEMEGWSHTPEQGVYTWQGRFEDSTRIEILADHLAS